MLVLSGVELIFFIVASVRLCSGFVLKSVLIIQRYFHYCWGVLTQGQGLLCSSHHCTSKEAGVAHGVGRGHGWDSWAQLTKGIFHTVWGDAQHIKLEEEEEREGCSGWWCLSSQVTVRHDGALLPWRSLNTCLWWEVVNGFFILLCLRAWLFLSLLNCLYFNLRVFLLLPFWFFPILEQGKWSSSWMELSGQTGLTTTAFPGSLA